MTIHIKVANIWETVSSIRLKASGIWENVTEGYIKVAGSWAQFFPGTRSYTFFFGNTVHVGTNGYISLDGGQTAINISSTVDRVLGILPADLVMNSVRWAASSTRFYIFWRGKRFSGGTDFEIEYEVHFIDGQDYALIKLVSFPSSTYSLTGYYVDGSSTGYSRITTTRTVGAEYRVYFNTTAAFATAFTEFGTSTHPVWLTSGSVTAGSSDDGYYTIVANQGSSAQAPTSVSASSITKTTASITWAAVSRDNSGMSAIQSYDYSLNGGSTWTSTGTDNFVNLTGLTASTSYTVLVRANNYYFTGTNYGSVNFTTSAGPVNIVPPSLSTNTGNYSSGSIITVDPGVWTGTSSYLYQILYSSSTPVSTSSSGVTLPGTTYTITNTDATNPSYYFRAKVTGYELAGQTGDSAIAYGTDTSPRSYIVPTTTISVGSATSSGFTISGTAGPVSGSFAYVSVNEIYIYNSSFSLVTTITSSLPTVNVSTGAWSYAWSGGSSNTTYYAKVKVASTSTDVQYFTTGFSSSITTTAAAPSPPTGLSVTRAVGSDFISTALNPAGSGNSTKVQTWSFGRNTTFTVNFTRGTNATESEMYYNTTGLTPAGTVSQNGGTSSAASGSFTYVGPASTTNNNDYAVYFWVRSYTSTDKSAWTYAGTQNVDTPSYSGFEIRLYRTNVSSGIFTSASPPRNDLTYTWTGVNTSFAHQAQVRLTFDGTLRIANS